jgi:hypothetical protein
MGMKPRVSKPAAMLLFDEEDGRNLIRVSIWVDPEDLELEVEPSSAPTIPVSFRRGRNTIFGKIDRDAYKTWLTKDEPELRQPVPMPTDNGSANRSPVLRAFVR